MTMITCAHCGAVRQKSTGAVNRSRKAGLRLFCGRRCSGLAHRSGKPRDRLRADKAAYDREYRRRNRTRLKAKKAQYFKATYNPIAAAEQRKGRAEQHKAYCRRPAYRKWKKGYDRSYRATREFGEYAESFVAVMEIYDEVNSRMTRTDIYAAKGALNKSQERRRDYERLIRNDA